MQQCQICTQLELKEFIATQADSIQAYHLSNFIEAKSHCKYTIIEIDFLIGVLDALSEHSITSAKIHANFKKKWLDKCLPNIQS